MEQEHDSKGLYTRRRSDGMYGLYARIEFQEGARILDIASGDAQERNFRTIEVDAGHFLHPEGMFTNHSCDPTSVVDKARGLLVARRNIKEDEEITFDYLQSETDMEADFACSCGATNCVGRVSKSS